jgi:hypothetical protein
MAHRRINQIYDPVLSVEIAATKTQRLVYLSVANKPIRYTSGYSRIVYIGATEKGIRRASQGASKHIVSAGEQLSGIKRLDAYLRLVEVKKGTANQRRIEFLAYPGARDAVAFP